MEEKTKTEPYKGIEPYQGKTLLLTFDATGKFKSVWRAMRRGHVSHHGIVYPSRPFNNRKPTLGRKLNEDKKGIYAELVKQRAIQ